jgi:hypothetical protein
MRKLCICLLSITILSISCKKIRDDLLPVSNTKMFCQSILTPDSTIRVYVGRTSGILNREPSFINDAIVLLYRNSILLDTLTNDKNGTYISSVFPRIGDSYSIEVIKDGMLKGNTIVPDSIRLIEPKIVFPTGYDALNTQYFGQLDFEINDNPDVDNFYEVIIFNKTHDDISNMYYYQYFNDPNYIILPDKVVQNEGDWDYFPTTLFFSDQLFNGKKQHLSFCIAAGYSIRDDVWISDLEEYGYVLLRSISKEYYMYRKYYTRHAYNSKIHTEGIGNMLFTGEPLDMYTNVSGGLGIVAAFSSAISKIKRK